MKTVTAELISENPMNHVKDKLEKVSLKAEEKTGRRPKQRMTGKTEEPTYTRGLSES